MSNCGCSPSRSTRWPAASPRWQWQKSAPPARPDARFHHPAPSAAPPPTTAPTAPARDPPVPAPPGPAPPATPPAPAAPAKNSSIATAGYDLVPDPLAQRRDLPNVHLLTRANASVDPRVKPADDDGWVDST